MTQEQKQFIIKTLQSGIPALAETHVQAFEEVVRVSEAQQEDLNGQEGWQVLNEVYHNNIINTLLASVPFMANEYIASYIEAVNAGQAKFAQNAKVREEKEKAEKEAADKEEEKKEEEKKV